MSSINAMHSSEKRQRDYDIEYSQPKAQYTWGNIVAYNMLPHVYYQKKLQATCCFMLLGLERLSIPSNMLPDHNKGFPGDWKEFN